MNVTLRFAILLLSLVFLGVGYISRKRAMKKRQEMETGKKEIDTRKEMMEINEMKTTKETKKKQEMETTKEMMNRPENDKTNIIPNPHLFSALGWVLFGLYWLTYISFYQREGDYTNAFLCFAALPFFGYLGLIVIFSRN